MVCRPLKIGTILRQQLYRLLPLIGRQFLIHQERQIIRSIIFDGLDDLRLKIDGLPSNSRLACSSRTIFSSSAIRSCVFIGLPCILSAVSYSLIVRLVNRCVKRI